jgi:Xaa-Pro aminopeptidase
MDAVKEGRLRQLCRDLERDGVLLRRRSNIAWITDGADVHCDTTQATGVAAVLWTPRRKVVLTNTIEAPRLRAEEFAKEWSFDVVPWWRPRRTLRHNFATDWPDPARRPKKPRDGLDDADAIASLRAPLTTREAMRARELGRDCAEVMQGHLRGVRRGVTEHEIAGRFGAELRRRGMHAPVLLVAADDRIARFRHPVPTHRRLERTLMVAVCAMRHGLIVSMTRLVHFGRLPAALRRKHAAVCAVDEALIGATRPGAKWSEILAAGIRAYRAGGFGKEWKLHHQGGPMGYECRDFCVTPTTSGAAVPNQVVGWNPSISGTKSEDAVLTRSAADAEVLTAMTDWPMLGSRPDILVRRAR